MASHDMEQVENYAGRVIVMDQTVEFDGTIQQWREKSVKGAAFMSDLLNMFSYSFIQRGSYCRLLISLCAALLGVILVQKRLLTHRPWAGGCGLCVHRFGCGSWTAGAGRLGSRGGSGGLRYYVLQSEGEEQWGCGHRYGCHRFFGCRRSHYGRVRRF